MIIIIISIYKWGKWGTKKFPKVTELESRIGSKLKMFDQKILPNPGCFMKAGTNILHSVLNT